MMEQVFLIFAIIALAVQTIVHIGLIIFIICDSFGFFYKADIPCDTSLDLFIWMTNEKHEEKKSRE